MDLHESQSEKENDCSWIGVDLDGTLAKYDGWKGIRHIGDPIPAMVARVKRWLSEGRNVRIFTARVDEGPIAVGVVSDWVKEHIGTRLLITNVKDGDMVELWDDRAVTVEKNTGRPLAPSSRNLCDDYSKDIGLRSYYLDIFIKLNESERFRKFIEANYTIQQRINDEEKTIETLVIEKPKNDTMSISSAVIYKLNSVLLSAGLGNKATKVLNDLLKVIRNDSNVNVLVASEADLQQILSDKKA